MYCTEDCKCSLCRELRGIDYRRETNRSKKMKHLRDNNFSMIKKAQSTFELNPRSEIRLKNNKYPSTTDLLSPGQRGKEDGKHKVIIYFSDAYKPNSGSQDNLDVDHAKRLAEEIQIKRQSCEKLNETPNPPNPPNDFMKQLKTVLEEKTKGKTAAPYDRPAPKPPTSEQLQQRKQQDQPKKPAPLPNEKPNVVKKNNETEINQSTFTKSKPLPSYIESIENNVIKLKIEQNFKKASELVELISSYKKRKKSCRNIEESSVHELNFSHENIDEDEEDEDGNEDDDETASEPDEGFYYDWSFVQEWRSR